MRIVKSVPAMQGQARRWQRAGIAVGFVPTMGYLHAGHLSLVRRARQLVGRRGKVVVSIYVNPTQFAPNEDLSRYPRDLRQDTQLCRAEGVDVVLVPGDGEMYPKSEAGAFSTFVVEESLARGMEGASRPTHFRGVTTVVAKLFNLVLPTVAVFGAKDFQQAAIIKRMVRDLAFPVRIAVAPIFREPDGLAMSSRNKYLEGDLRRQALVLSQSIKKVQATFRNSKHPPHEPGIKLPLTPSFAKPSEGRPTPLPEERGTCCTASGVVQGFKARAGSGNSLPAARLKAEVRAFIEREPDARLDYVEFFDPETLIPRAKVTRGTQMALAVYIGATRLIDNAAL